MRVCHVGEEGRGELVVWLVTFEWIIMRACVKAGQPDHQDNPDKQNASQKACQHAIFQDQN